MKEESKLRKDNFWIELKGLVDEVGLTVYDKWYNGSESGKLKEL